MIKEIKMRYTSPLRHSKPYWIPIVCKNRDYLIGYLNGIGLIEFTLTDIFKQMKIGFDFDDLDLFLDSSRFNDVMEDGRRECELGEEEKKKLFIELFEHKIKAMSKEHIENSTKYNDVLRIECICGLGFYGWKSYDDIPAEQFTCTGCGRVLIDYTGNDDYNYKFDGGKNENQQKG